MAFFSFFNQKKTIPDPVEAEWERIRSLPEEDPGYAYGILDKPFRFHHAASFINTYREIFQDELYKFTPKINSNAVILDCGANMGLSVLYFARNYPDHRIIAFEPENHVFGILEENVKTFGLKNVELHKKAVWTEETELDFQSDGGMGGRVNDLYRQSEMPVSRVSTVALANLLTENIDFLKIDIEGAEVEVLQACRGKLSLARHIFFEYHNDIHKPQSLHRLLQLISEEGFTYHIKESSARKRPFVDQSIICERFDMAITVFCYK